MSADVASTVPLAPSQDRLGFLIPGYVSPATGKSNVAVYCPNSKTSLARLKMGLSQKQAKALLYHLEQDQSFLGALQAGIQYSYLRRQSWSGANPEGAVHMLFFDLRYILP